MKTRLYALCAFALLLWPCANASLVKEEISVGPIDVLLPRWHHEVTLERLHISTRYQSDAREPGPFSSIELIEVEANLGTSGQLDVSMRSAQSCEEAWDEANQGSAVNGRRCLRWDDGSYVVVEFRAKFDPSSTEWGLEYLAMVSVRTRDNPSAPVCLCK